ncbi:alpha/beta hydrolase [Asticcacaulis sp. ZE23SCel15]|uniref:alpha/beta fold hydrolase n=1 Tax=Asticcacaulis sp. ZE23SCel15 TaxID=3059027 RepID=UPI00265EA484|nr:alpha/beta hydrolase [Asticcacaulis sp. ZE23SCel15]WKL56538.1 alpha/beta hydrolase [Asticcacaulis sp. ZE23SCel15]
MQKGPLIILLPGTDGTGLFFADLRAYLSKEFDVEVISYPQTGDQSYETLGNWLLHQLPTVRDYILVAESFGGPLAIWLAAHARHKPIKLIMGATFAASPFGWAGKVALHLLPIGLIIPLRSWQINLVLFNGKYPETARLIYQTVLPIDRKTLLNRVRSVLSCDMTNLLSEITVPTLIIHPKKDRLIPYWLPHHFPTAPNFDVIKLDLPHMVFQTAPEETLEKHLITFIHKP